MTNFIEIYENALSTEICSRASSLIDDFVNNGHKSVEHEVSQWRNDYQIVDTGIPQFNDISLEIKKCVKMYFSDYNNKYTITSRPFKSIFDKIKYQKSAPGGGFTTWHCEQSHVNNSTTRFAVWMIYLNTLNDNGHTEFKHQGVAVIPKAGTLLLWPAAYTHLHRSAPGLMQNKYIATGWLCF